MTTMTTLLAAPVGPLLDRLFAEDEAADPATMPSVAAYWNAHDAAGRQRLMQSRTDYPQLYGRLRDLPLAVSRDTGRLLYLLARAIGARSIVEFGTSFGLSTLCLAAALRDVGHPDARLVTSEFEPSKVARAAANLRAGGLADLVELRAGDALATLARDLPDEVDLLLLDGAKALYPDILDLVEPRLRPGALVVADNVDFFPPFATRMRAPGSGYLSVAVGDEVEVSLRLG